mgnify:CR=1 FL=1
MPELPEVETVRCGLEKLVKGYTITAAHDLHPRALKPESIAPLKSISGAKIIGLNRRGKFLWFVLDRPQVLVAHLGMSGQFLIHEKNRPEAKHVRAKFELSKNIRKKELVFNDQRTFGWVSVEETTDGVPSSAQHIARDPFDSQFDLQETIEWLQAFNAAAVATYAAKTGKSEDVLASALLGANGDGTRYTAAEALAFGFVDEVLPVGKKSAKSTARNDRSGELAARARLLRAKSV